MFPSLFPSSDFGESTRAAIVKKLFDRYDELYIEWLVGAYGDMDLGLVIHSDMWVNQTWVETEHLIRHHSRDSLFTWFDQISVHRWLYDRHGMSELPKRKTIHHPVIVSYQRARKSVMYLPKSSVSESEPDLSDCDSEDIPPLEPLNQASVNNITGKRTVEHAPRRSERIKKQREIY